MHLIKNNPYRTVGLLVGATAKEQERQIKRLKQFLDAEQEPQDDFSFPSLGKIHRTVDSVGDAASRLNLDSDKINAALFWFYKGNAITDEPALDSLKDAEIQSATDIWTKLTATGEVTQRNSSAFQNLSTLLLCNAFNGSTVNPTLLEQGITYKLKFLESDFVKDFKALATDETYKTSKKELQLLFLNQLQAEIDRNAGITSNKFLDILNKQNFSAKEDFLKGFVQKPIEQIEKKIEDAKIKRKANKANAVLAGKTLYEQTAESLSQLKSILGTSNLKFSSISDKVSDEVLQCGIEYFSHYRDSNTDPSNASMDLFSKAKSLAIGNIAKQRCQENTENLQEWIDDAPERVKQKLISDDLQFITSKLERFQNLSNSVANAKDLVDSCKPRLVNIKKALGLTDDLYLNISSAIVGNAQGMLVTAVNEAQERFTKFQNLRNNNFISYRDSPRLSTFDLIESLDRSMTLDELSVIVNTAYDVSTSMQSMEMFPNLKQQFQKNRDALGNIKSQINSVTNRSNSSNNSSSGGCYIATMAYGDYNHPQVYILRHYRDNILDKSILGKRFIEIYYHYSPQLVEMLKNKKALNNIIRKTLDLFIKLIK